MGPGPGRTSRTRDPHPPGAAETTGARRPDDVVCAHAWVAGRVQGVGFRLFILARAERLRLSGFVRNLPDRRVEIVAEGRAADVAALLDAARRGPAGARVAGVEVAWETPHVQSGFAIRDDGRG